MALAGNQHTGSEEELNPCIVRQKTAPAGAVTANFGNLVSHFATDGKCDEECRYLVDDTIGHERRPDFRRPAKRQTRAESFGPARVVT